MIFNEKKIEISNLKINKSPGPDLIHPCMLKEMSVARHYKKLFSRCIKNGEVLMSWKILHINPVLKKG